MNRIQVPPLNREQLAELEELYQKTAKPPYRFYAAYTFGLIYTHILDLYRAGAIFVKL